MILIISYVFNRNLHQNLTQQVIMAQVMCERLYMMGPGDKVKIDFLTGIYSCNNDGAIQCVQWCCIYLCGGYI